MERECHIRWGKGMDDERSKWDCTYSEREDFGSTTERACGEHAGTA